jgi:hypothetical protein
MRDYLNRQDARGAKTGKVLLILRGFLGAPGVLAVYLIRH